MKNENETKLKTIDDSIIRDIVSVSNSFPDVCIKLGFDPNIGNMRSNIERKIKRLDISTEHFDTVKRVRDSKKRYNKENLLLLVTKFDTLKEILLELDLLPVSTNYKKLRKVFKEFDIDDSKYDYIRSDHYQKEKLEECVLSSNTYKECLEKLGIRAAGGNYKYLKKYISLYNISTSHFVLKYKITKKLPIEEFLIENSNCSRANLKRRLFEEELIENKCCLCGQDGNWNGMKISLILDHINGVHNDNRLENLRIVCPNCNAGLDTFAGKNTERETKEYLCKCGDKIYKNSKECINCHSNKRRKVERPPYNQLIKEVDQIGYSATGRKYDVSDNTIRKWINKYKLETI